MILSDTNILKEIEQGNIIIQPTEYSLLNPNSVDLRLGESLKIYTEKLLDPKQINTTKELFIPEDGLVLYPGELYLGYTVEKAGSHIYHSQLKGKSSLARLGIFIDCTASWGDTGFVNNWTLEISVVKPVKVYKNMRIAQIIFTEVKGIVSNPYDKKKDSKYNEDNKAKESLYYLNFKNND